MHAKRQRQLTKYLSCLTMIAIIILLILYALRQNISLFYTPNDIAQGKAPIGQAIRVGGMVVKGSLKRGARLKIKFTLTDYKHKINVTYQGILPDLFREGQGIVATGVLVDKYHFKADTVLAKHDENYMPPELREMTKDKVSNDS